MCLQRSKEHKVAPRQVYQFHFTAWPDKSVPTQAGGVLSYLHDIHKKRDEIRDTGPLIVHCRYDCIVPHNLSSILTFWGVQWLEWLLPLLTHA